MVPQISSLPRYPPHRGSKYGVDASLFNDLRHDPGDVVENHYQAKGWVSLTNSALRVR